MGEGHPSGCPPFLSMKAKVRVNKKAKRNVKVVMDVFQRSLMKMRYGWARRVCETFRTDLIERIEDQRFQHAPLSPKYLEWKQRKGLDERILIATRFYIDHIAVRRSHRGYKVGVGDARSPNAKVSLRQIVRWLEFGTTQMPARPHWRPMISIYTNKLRTGKESAYATFMEEVRRHLREYGYKV